MNEAAPASFLRGPWWALLGVAVLLALAWYLRQVLIYFFGGVLLAATVHAMADPLARVARLPRHLAVAVVLIGIPVVLAGVVWWLGAPIADQLQSLATELPKAWQTVQTWLGQHEFGARMLHGIRNLGLGSVPWEKLVGVANVTIEAFFTAFLMLVMGIYLMFSVGLYRDGFVRLVPVRHRRTVSEALDAAGAALKSWLLGQAITMLAIGAVSALGLWMLGAPLPFGLGLIAGLLEFVPYIGPIASGALAVLVGFGQSPQMALYVLLLFVAIDQIEGHLLVPLTQRWAVRQPPVLTVLAVLVFGSLFGLAGVLFGTPLMVVTMVLVEKLYVEYTLEGGAQAKGAG
jgi:predicted PurR-regulated permease PerM